MSTVFPPRVNLANTPTPLQYLERTSEALGVEFFVKRDDMTGAELSGNKIRKLEYLLAEAVELGCDVVITGGGQQSNHCRATALAATRLGLRSRLCLRIDDKTRPPRTSGNILLDRLAGAEIRWIDHEDWARQNEIYEEEASALRAQGFTPYIIPEGGSNALGAWGYIECAQEISHELAELPPAKTSIVYACGSGGTGAGLILGSKLFAFDELQAQIFAVNVCDDAPYFRKRIAGICQDTIEKFQLNLQLSPNEIQILDGHVGLGYAKSRPEELKTIADLASREGLILDPVYSGKAFHGLLQEIQENKEKFGERIIFVHTGGIFGLFPVAKLFDELW